MTEKSERRWYQFSLRALLVFVLLVSIGMSWLGVNLQRAKKQRVAVKAFEKLGFQFWYERLYYEDPTKSSVPQWARAVFGEDFFFDVLSVDGSGTGFGQSVAVYRTDFGNDEAAYLKGLTDLDHLDLHYTQVTDVGLEHLEGLTSLERLNLGDTQVTDSGLGHLKGLTSLARLHLNNTQVSGAGLVHLKGLTNLEWLDLDNTQVTDAGLEHLKGLTKLEWLNLAEMQVSDAGLEHLEGLTNLRLLSLSGTQVTDAGLEHIEGLTNLEKLYLSRTQVTAEGIESLRQSLPNCSISP